MGLMTTAGADTNSSFKYVRIIDEKERAVIDVGMPALSIYKPSAIFVNSNTPAYVHYVFSLVQWALPSRYHSIHKNELARAMVGGTQNALVELRQKRAQGSDTFQPEVEFYEYEDMKPFFDNDDPQS